jgi:hypothetical protein
MDNRIKEMLELPDEVIRKAYNKAFGDEYIKDTPIDVLRDSLKIFDFEKAIEVYQFLESKLDTEVYVIEADGSSLESGAYWIVGVTLNENLAKELTNNCNTEQERIEKALEENPYVNGKISLYVGRTFIPSHFEMMGIAPNKYDDAEFIYGTHYFYTKRKLLK